MPERTVWQVREMFPNNASDLEDLGDWEPFAVGPEGGIFLRRQNFIEDDPKSSVNHKLSFAQRHDAPYVDTVEED